jgi:hypothetical protein
MFYQSRPGVGGVSGEPSRRLCRIFNTMYPTRLMIEWRCHSAEELRNVRDAHRDSVGEGQKTGAGNEW